MTDNTFKYDLEEGKSAEWWFCKCLKAEYNITETAFNESDVVSELRKWDIKGIDKEGKVATFEIKYDRKSETTGNFAIEYYGRTAPSGLSATTAKYWVILSADSFFIFDTLELISFIKNNSFSQIQINNGTAWCYLIPIEKAKQIVKAIKPNTYK